MAARPLNWTVDNTLKWQPSRDTSLSRLKEYHYGPPCHPTYNVIFFFSLANILRSDIPCLKSVKHRNNYVELIVSSNSVLKQQLLLLNQWETRHKPKFKKIRIIVFDPDWWDEKYGSGATGFGRNRDASQNYGINFQQNIGRGCGQTVKTNLVAVGGSDVGQSINSECSVHT
ncbi:unnamed protein product [Arabis nemorensis]|uniref:Uncharacterized protein n=1 Tax=Arabis nemorensis TaxID=586526 RepID=A0A565C4B6_9BRAS|nr:unnamed protein product [Arabis nemorensis]